MCQALHPRPNTHHVQFESRDVKMRLSMNGFLQLLPATQWSRPCCHCLNRRVPLPFFGKAKGDIWWKSVQNHLPRTLPTQIAADPRAPGYHFITSAAFLPSCQRRRPSSCETEEALVSGCWGRQSYFAITATGQIHHRVPTAEPRA